MWRILLKKCEVDEAIVRRQRKVLTDMSIKNCSPLFYNNREISMNSVRLYVAAHPDDLGKVTMLSVIDSVELTKRVMHNAIVTAVRAWCMFTRFDECAIVVDPHGRNNDDGGDDNGRGQRCRDRSSVTIEFSPIAKKRHDGWLIEAKDGNDVTIILDADVAWGIRFNEMNLSLRDTIANKLEDPADSDVVILAESKRPNRGNNVDDDCRHPSLYDTVLIATGRALGLSTSCDDSDGEDNVRAECDVWNSKRLTISPQQGAHATIISNALLDWHDHYWPRLTTLVKVLSRAKNRLTATSSILIDLLGAMTVDLRVAIDQMRMLID